MAYTDPRCTQVFTKLSGAPVEVEDTADILALQGRVPDVGTGTDANFDAVYCPAGCEIESFGVEIFEALTNANATHCVVALKAVAADQSTTTTVATLTLPKDTTEVTPGNVSGGTVLPNTATAAQAVAVGARFVSSDTDLPYTVPQGGKFYVEVTTAAGAAGGSFKAFVVYRQNGAPAAVALSPVTKLAV
jgi:hypothetical protein